MVSKNNYQLYQQKHVDGKQRWGIRKLSVGVASVLLGTTFMLYGNHAVLADTVTSPSDDVTRSITTQGGNKDKVTEGTTSTPQTSGDSTDKGQGKTLTETPTGTDKQANDQKVDQQVPTTDTEEATNHQDTPQGQNPTQVQDTTQNTANDGKKDTEVKPTNDATTPTTQNTINVGKKDTEVTPANDATTLDTQKTPAKFKVRAARSVVNPTSADSTTSNNEEASTSLPMSNQVIKLDSQPMLTEIINKPTDNWVYKNLNLYKDSSTSKVKEILQNHTTNDESGRYYFAGAANYNESLHVIYLLARSNNLNDNNLYVTILHTGLYKNIQEAVVAPGESKPVEYESTTHTPIFTNYDGTSVSIGLDGLEKGDNEHGMVVGFAYGYDTGISGDQASMGNGFMTTPMPTKTTTTIHYIDQATGDELAVPKSFEGVAYQKYTITGEAPTIDGYTLKKSPETTGYISPYKVGESYDFRLDKHVVIKQTVIDSQGLIRITAYYDGEAINNTTRYLGTTSDNDLFSFVSHGKSYTYINQITSTNDGIVYYYAKDGSEDKSEVRVHYIDVTGNKSSLFVPGDGEEVATDKISGELGKNYNYNVNVPTDYNLATNQANTVTGTYTIDHHDEYVYVVKKTSAEVDPIVPDKTKVDEPTSLTADEKKTIEDKIVEANKDKFLEGTGVTVANDGTATITYPDKSFDTISSDQLVEEKTSAEKHTVAAGKPVTLTHGQKVKEGDSLDSSAVILKDAKGQAVSLPNGAKVVWATAPDTSEVWNDKTGQAKVVYGDTSESEPVTVTYNVTPNDADQYTPTVPAKTKVDDPTKLTADEKKEVEDKVTEANKDQFPAGTQVTIGNDGTATITYPDKSVDTIEGKKLVEEKNSAEKLDPTVPAKTKVDNPTSLTADEKKTIEDKIVEANKDKFPEGTGVTVANDGTATITYPDKSVDTIEGKKLVEEKTSAEKLDPTVPAKTKVDDSTKLTDDEKKEVEDNIRANNPGLPEGTKIKVGDNGDTTITYPDTSVDTIPGKKLVEEKNSSEKLDPTVKDKTKVDDPTKLTDDEKKEVEDNIRSNNPGLPEGTKIDVGDNGDTTITYPDTSVDTITGDKLVEEKTSAENLDPTVKAKTKVDDPTKLTNDEKKEVEDKVTEANKDKFPEGTEVTVDDDGTVTINYPDGSQDTIPGDQVVEAKTDADKTNPTVLGTKVKVKDSNNLTDEEKQQVKESIENANKDQFSEGTQVTIGNDGTATITYPDGSQDVIPGSQLVTKQGSDVANTGDVKNNGQGTTASIQGVTADTTAKKLPQTGEQDTSATAATGLGLIILSLLGLFGLGSKKRKED